MCGVVVMVDFNNESTITTPAADVVKITILQRRYDLLDSMEMYEKMSERGVAGGVHVVKSRLWTLFRELRPLLARRGKDKKGGTDSYTIILSLLEKGDFSSFDRALALIDEELDDLGLIKIDTKQRPSTHIVQRNRTAGQE